LNIFANNFENIKITQSIKLFASLPYAFLPFFHAFHTSITQIEYNAKAKTYEISVRVFTDDLTKAIDIQNKTHNTKIEDGDKNEQSIFKYINTHFSIVSAQNKKVEFKFIGKENEDLATWIYIEIPESALSKGTKIQQNVLMDLFDDQVNILNFKKADERRTLLFDTKNKVKTWE
jgi:hypothetical protein